MKSRGDVREGARWSLAQRTKNDVIHALAISALAIVRNVPRESVVRWARRVGAVVHWAAFSPRALATRNVAIAFPNMSLRDRKIIVKRAFVNLAGHLAETLASDPPPPLSFSESSRAILRDALAEGRGVVLPSAHLGPWERLAATLVGAGFPLTAIVRESYDPRFDRIIDGARARVGVDTIARGLPGAATRIVRTLRKGRVLGIPMDLATRAESVTVPLLGAPARTAVGPARIAIRTRAPVVVCTVEPDGNDLAVTCTRLATQTDEGVLTARINEELGRRIEKSPEHWPWMHPRFLTEASGDNLALTWSTHLGKRSSIDSRC